MSVGKPFPKGKSGNPGGRPEMPSDVKQVRLLNQVGFVKTANRYLSMNSSEINAARGDANLSMMEKAMLEVVQRSSRGDLDCFKILLDRLIGKAPDTVLTSDEEQQLAHMTDDQLLVTATKMIEDFKSKKVSHG